MVTQEPLFDKSQTARHMKRLIETYHNDLKGFFVTKNGKRQSLMNLPLKDFFTFLKNIPYEKDIQPLEVIARPQVLLQRHAPALDCKKKSILMASWIRGNGYKYRLIGSSNRKTRKIHHVFPQIKTNAGFLNMDATYNDYRPFQQKKVTAWEIL